MGGSYLYFFLLVAIQTASLEDIYVARCPTGQEMIRVVWTLVSPELGLCLWLTGCVLQRRCLTMWRTEHFPADDAADNLGQAPFVSFQHVQRM